MKLGNSEPTQAPIPNAAPEAPNVAVAEPKAPSDKPFNDEPFDAGVEADEQSDPKKYIEQLSGKLGQSLRKYTEEQGGPDFELEKFAVNSILSATNTAKMDSEDQNDIIKKVKTSGNQEDNSENPEETNDNNDSGDMNGNDDINASTEPIAPDNGEETGVDESKKKGNDFLITPKKLSIFAPKGSEEAKHNIKAKLSETFNQEKMHQPEVQPVVKPAPTKTPAPSQPSRKNKPFLPSPSVQPDPKAMGENNSTKQDLSQLGKDSEQSRTQPDTATMARELASMSKNINDMIAKQVKFFAGKKVTDSEQITHIIAQTAELIKNR